MLKLNVWVSSLNDAMQSREDAVAALREVVDRLERGDSEGVIKDINGNRVGDFDLRIEED